MPAYRTIIDIDVQIAKLRASIDSSLDQNSPETLTRQTQVNQLIQQRHTQLLKLEKQKIEATRARSIAR